MADNFRFETDKYICDINLPVMILHAEDDGVVPYRLGYKVKLGVGLIGDFNWPLFQLYQAALKCRNANQGQVIFHPFKGQYKFGHKFICRAVDLPDKIR